MRINEIVTENISRRGFLKGAAAVGAAAALPMAANASQEPVKQLQQRCDQIFNTIRKTSASLLSTQLSQDPQLEQKISAYNNIISSFRIVVKPDAIIFGKGPAYVNRETGYRVITLDSEVWDGASTEALAWVMAHEFGHCIDHNVFHATTNNPSQREQWADNIANSICKAMGITKSNALSVAYKNMRSTYDKEVDPTYTRNSLQRSMDPGNHPTVGQRIQQAKKQGIELSKAQSNSNLA